MTPGTSHLPLKAMGRFNHEAVAVDPRTSIVYIAPVRQKGYLKFLYVIPIRCARSAARRGWRMIASMDLSMETTTGRGSPGTDERTTAQRQDAQPQLRVGDLGATLHKGDVVGIALLRREQILDGELLHWPPVILRGHGPVCTGAAQAKFTLHGGLSPV